MAYAILNSKLVAERITVTFSFVNELAPLEAITSQEVTVEVLVGEDPEPEDLLFQTAGTDGQVVSQQIQNGVPGVIYQLICTVGTDAGQTVQKISKLAILPTPVITPDIYGVRYTTMVYPIDVLETLTHGMGWTSGRLREMPFPYEYATYGMSWVSGTIRELLIRFTAPPEYITTGMDWVSGTIRDLLITFAAPEEQAQFGMNWTSGELRDVLIEYATQPESIQPSMSFISGTLT